MCGITCQEYILQRTGYQSQGPNLSRRGQEELHEYPWSYRITSFKVSISHGLSPLRLKLTSSWVPRIFKYWITQENYSTLSMYVNVWLLEGFHVASYQAHFASHLTRDCHVGFLSPQSGIGKYNQMFQNFYLVHISIPSYDRKTRILAHTLGWNLESCCEVNPKYQRVLSFFSIPIYTKRKRGSGAKSCANRCGRVPRRENPLLVS